MQIMSISAMDQFRAQNKSHEEIRLEEMMKMPAAAAAAAVKSR